MMPEAGFMESINPATLEVVGRVAVVTPEELSQRIASCRRAQAEWSSLPLKERMRLMDALQHVLAEETISIARTVCSETGKPKMEAVNTDVLASIATCQYCSWAMPRLEGRRRVDQGRMSMLVRILGRRSYIHLRPLGVVGIISPFNFPFAIPFSEAAMAVAAGNGAIIKPSPETPLSGEMIEEVFKAAGFPKGLVQTVSGPGLGEALVVSDVDRLIFTGSPQTGRKVMEAAASRLTPITLELGGKDAMIVLEDADLDRAVAGAVWGAFVNSGQVCVAVKRIFVATAIYEAFVRAMVSSTEALRQGWGWDDPDVSIGPMINSDAVEAMEGQVRRALEQGARIATGGRRSTALGHFFLPTILVDAPMDSDIMREETFGPLVTIHPFLDAEEAVAIANDSEFALSGSVWTSDLRRGRELAERLAPGSVLVNNVAYTYGLPATPWGGRGKSGFGRTHGEMGLMEMMEAHHVHVDKARFAREMWWHPYDLRKLNAHLALIRIGFQGRYRRAWRDLREMRRILRGR
jgi:acyl-CoA reductase-like NAD-dependent aldehyde dehydrogenase